MTTEGTEFINAKPEQVIEYLEHRNVRHLEVSPSGLLVKNRGRNLRLYNTAAGEEYPVRKTFLYKLLKWNSFPLQQLDKLSLETAAGICNDFLLQMKQERVRIKLENEDALTITSLNYSEITDLEIIKKLLFMKVKYISRNDFMLRIISEEKHTIEPVPGDEYGLGITVTNSETGFRALRISNYLLRYTCTNGASVKIENAKSRWIHFGHRKNDLSRFFTEQVKLASTKQDKLRESLAALIIKKATDNEDKLKKIQTALGRDKIKVDEQLSLYDFFNQVTDKAKKYDLTKRSYLEELAGGIL